MRVVATPAAFSDPRGFSFAPTSHRMVALTILFDLDGTLVDSAPDLADAANQLRAARRLPPLDEKLLRPIASRGSAALIDAALGSSSKEEAARLRTEFLANYAAGCSRRTQIFPGIREMLESLHAAGMSLAVFTNKPGMLARRVTADMGFDDLLAGVWASDDVGCTMKPDPTGILKVIQVLGAQPSSTLYIGDEPTDAAAARAAGIRCALVAWGYARTSLVNTNADFIASTPQELKAWIQGLC